MRVHLGTIKESQTTLLKQVTYLERVPTGLDVCTRDNVFRTFVDIAKVIKLLISLHEQTPECLPTIYQSLVQSCSSFTRYEETTDIKELNGILQKIPPLMSEPSLYQNTDSLMAIAKHIFNAQQLVSKLDGTKLKKRKNSSPIRVSPSPKGSPKSDETKKRSKTIGSASSAKAVLDPMRALSKELAYKAQGVALQRQISIQSKGKSSEKPDN
jgi:hypothetical protein